MKAEDISEVIHINQCTGPGNRIKSEHMVDVSRFSVCKPFNMSGTPRHPKMLC